MREEQNVFGFALIKNNVGTRASFFVAAIYTIICYTYDLVHEIHLAAVTDVRQRSKWIFGWVSGIYTRRGFINCPLPRKILRRTTIYYTDARKWVRKVFAKCSHPYIVIVCNIITYKNIVYVNYIIINR